MDTAVDAHVRLVADQYGKAEVRLVRVDRDTPRHEVTDLTVSVGLQGDLAAAHLTGDNTAVLPTDTQKNTVYAFARDGVGPIEEFGLRLARHFVATQPAITRARVRIERHFWERLGPHSFARGSGETRTATVTVTALHGETVRGETHAHVESGLHGLVLMNTTDSEFVGFVRDRYTTLPEAADRILATEVDAMWRHAGPGRPDGPPEGWDAGYAAVRAALVEAFTGTYSRSLQQTLYAMGTRVLTDVPGVDQIRLSLPNKHHFPVDLSPFGLDNPGEVFVAVDRPYGLIEGTVARA
ncbi:MAG: urate oxidase [Hamadaea sp.]|nr:urate oxidase [Hamadaea sp.]